MTERFRTHTLCWTLCLFAATTAAIASTRATAAAAFDCMIEPTQTIEVRSAVGGLIESITVRRGDRVKKGQVLVTLESSAEKAAAEAARFRAQMEGPEQVAQTKLAYAKKKYSRRRDMAAERLMSGQDRDDAEGDMKSAEAELVLARENRDVAALDATQQESLLSRRTIRAPFSGVVADQLLYPGEVIEPSDPKKPILKLAQLNPLRVHVILPRTAFGSVKPGMRAEVTPELPSIRHVEGTVRIADSLIDAASGTFAVFLEVPNPELDVPAGLKCRASFPQLKGP
jgi:RND family efflux transporter MFP subunit